MDKFSRVLCHWIIRKRYYKTLGTSVINGPLSPSSLDAVRLLNTKLARLKFVSHFYWKKMCKNMLYKRRLIRVNLAENCGKNWQLSFIFLFRSISSAVKQRFPTLDHVVEAGTYLIHKKTFLVFSFFNILKLIWLLALYQLFVRWCDK